MSNESLLNKLMDLDQIDWKPLGEIGDFTRGKRFVKTDIVAEGTPCIHYGELYTHYGIWADKAKSYIDPQKAQKLRVAAPGDVVIVAAGEEIEDIGNATAWMGKSDVVIHDACFSYRSKLDPKYVSYFLRTKQCKDQIKRHVSSGKISAINADGLGKAIIPIPCPSNPKKSLEIQGEIVRILDTFTELIAKLTAELTARKKQYNYYRDQLLRFADGDAEWKTLGELGEFIRGKRFTKADYVDAEGVPVIHYGEIYTRYGVFTNHSLSQVRNDMEGSLRYAERGDVVITDVGETIEDVGKAVAWLGDEKVCKRRRETVALGGRKVQRLPVGITRWSVAGSSLRGVYSLIRLYACPA